MKPIPEIVLQELLDNAQVHRDHFTSAPIRILVYTDRLDVMKEKGADPVFAFNFISAARTVTTEISLAVRAGWIALS